VGTCGTNTLLPQEALLCLVEMQRSLIVKLANCHQNRLLIRDLADEDAEELRSLCVARHIYPCECRKSGKSQTFRNLRQSEAEISVAATASEVRVMNLSAI
jgi:hypothetical protein